MNRGDVQTQPVPPLSQDSQYTVMTATFQPTNEVGAPISLEEKENACSVNGFNWQQHVTKDPYASTLHSIAAPTVPLSVLYLDPPPGGYTYQTTAPLGVPLDNISYAAYPFYYVAQSPSNWTPTPFQPYYPLSLQANENPPTVLVSCP